MRVSPDARPEQGSFFRSDHFPFAKIGVPSIDSLYRDVPEIAWLAGPVDLPPHQGELEVERAIGALAAVEKNQETTTDSTAEKQEGREGHESDLVELQISEAMQHGGLQRTGKQPPEHQ